MRDLSIESVVVAMVAGACSFSAQHDVSGDPAGVDAATDPDVTPPSDAELQIVPCDTPDPEGLVLCLELEDGVADGMLYDSSPARRHATTTGLLEVERPLDTASSRAALVAPDATTYVTQTAALELSTAYTLAAWVFPETVPATGDARGILDHEQQYAMLVRRGSGSVLAHHCAHTGGDSEWTEELPPDAWSFVACTWSGTELCAYRWTSATSHEQWCRPAGPPATTGAHGLAIGHLSENGEAHSRFDGKLDSVQVYSRRLTEAQLCTMLDLGANCM